MQYYQNDSTMKWLGVIDVYKRQGEHHPHLKEKIKAKAEKVKAGVR